MKIFGFEIGGKRKAGDPEGGGTPEIIVRNDPVVTLGIFETRGHLRLTGAGDTRKGRVVKIVSLNASLEERYFRNLAEYVELQRVLRELPAALRPRRSRASA